MLGMQKTLYTKDVNLCIILRTRTIRLKLFILNISHLCQMWTWSHNLNILEARADFVNSFIFCFFLADTKCQDTNLIFQLPSRSKENWVCRLSLLYTVRLEYVWSKIKLFSMLHASYSTTQKKYIKLHCTRC